MSDKEKHVGDTTEAAWSRLKEEATSTKEERSNLRALESRLFEQEKMLKEKKKSMLVETELRERNVKEREER